MNRIEVNVQTGEVKEIPLTPDEIAELEALAAQQEPPPPPIDPVEKLRAFLSANPDVAAVL